MLVIFTGMSSIRCVSMPSARAAPENRTILRGGYSILGGRALFGMPSQTSYGDWVPNSWKRSAERRQIIPFGYFTATSLKDANSDTCRSGSVYRPLAARTRLPFLTIRVSTTVEIFRVIRSRGRITPCVRASVRIWAVKASIIQVCCEMSVIVNIYRHFATPTCTETPPALRARDCSGNPLDERGAGGQRLERKARPGESAGGGFGGTRPRKGRRRSKVPAAAGSNTEFPCRTGASNKKTRQLRRVFGLKGADQNRTDE